MYTYYISQERIDSMNKIVEFIKKHKKLTVISTAAIILIILISRIFSGVRSVTLVPPQTVSLTKMDLEKVVSASGVIQSTDVRYVTPKGSGGTVKKINVSVGDKVNSGDVLIELDTDEIDRSIRSEKNSLNSAEAQNKRDISAANDKVKQAKETRDKNRDIQNADVTKKKSDLLTAQENERLRAEDAANKNATILERVNDINSAQTAYNNALKDEEADPAVVAQLKTDRKSVV